MAADAKTTEPPIVSPAVEGMLPDEIIQWALNVPITHPLMVLTYIKMFAVTALIMTALFSFMSAVTGSAQLIPFALEFTAVICGGLAVVVGLVTALLFRHGMAMQFRVAPQGADMAVVDRRARNVNRTALIAGVVSGKPQMAGAGLIAQASSRQHASWHSIARAKYYPRWRAIALANSWRTLFVLYCTPDNYQRVAAFVSQAMAQPRLPARKSPLPRLLLRSGLAVIASLPLFYLPSPIAVDPLAPLLVVSFALAAIWLVPLVAYAIFAGLLWIAGFAVLTGLTPFHSDIDNSVLPRYELMGTDDWVGVAIAGLGAAYLVWLAMRLLRGCIESALAGDMADMEKNA